jgi:hypothetical protein
MVGERPAQHARRRRLDRWVVGQPTPPHALDEYAPHDAVHATDRRRCIGVALRTTDLEEPAVEAVEVSRREPRCLDGA